MSVFERLGASMERMIEHFGSTITIKAPGGTFVPSDSSVTTSSASMTVSCSAPSPFDLRFGQNDNVQEGDFRLFVSAGDPELSFAPSTAHMAVFASETYQIVGVQVQRANGSVVGYELHLRGKD